MRNLAIVILFFLQSFAYAGPVCGNHLSVAESMACCKKAHHGSSKLSLSDRDANACCASCEMGKIQAIKRQDHFSLQQTAISIVAMRVESAIVFSNPDMFEWTPQKFGSLDPPEILLLQQTFRI